MKPRLFFAAITLVVLAGCLPRPDAQVVSVDQHDVDAASAEMAYLIATVSQSTPDAPVPDDNPDGSKCEKCNGRGKVGDGTTMVDCVPCDGTGVITRGDGGTEAEDETTEEPEPTPGYATVADPVTGVVASEPMVVMISQPNCPPCEGWWSGPRSSYNENGWATDKVDISRASPAPAVTPSFRVFDGRRWHGHDGWMTFRDCRQLISGSIASAVEQAELANGPHRYSHTYNWPSNDGGIAEHLMNPEKHGLALDGLVGQSQLELEELHSALHRADDVPVVQSIQQGCPSSQTARRRR